MDLQVLYSSDNHKIVGFYTRDYVDPSLLLQAAIDYYSDPEYINESFNPTDVKHEYWEIDPDTDDYDDDLEHYIVSDSDSGFPVTAFYLDDSYRIR